MKAPKNPDLLSISRILNAKSQTFSKSLIIFPIFDAKLRKNRKFYLSLKLMVSALDSGSGGPGSTPGRVTALCSWARYFTLIVPLSTQVYKWLLANLLPGVTLRWTSIPSRGSSNTSSCFMLRNG